MIDRRGSNQAPQPTARDCFHLIEHIQGLSQRECLRIPRHAATRNRNIQFRGVLPSPLSGRGLETLSAKLKELDYAKKIKGLLPDKFCFGLIDVHIKFCARRFDELLRCGAVNREWIAECERHRGELYRQSCKDYELTLPAASQTQQDS